MKSILFLFALSILILSCNTGVDSNNTATINATGIVQKIETSTWMYGTHSLDDSTGRHLYALTSSTVDLNNYENKSVKISGNLVAGYPVDGGPRYLNVTGISLIR